ncbi:MAG TPA: SDR family oxidoreductase, partial [Leptospiraceae bacterium]|nr:SDR family oxidoreductase [Leptospiraceae bacterium]
LIIGATGRVGQRLVQYSLNSNYKVTALVRDKSKLKSTNPNLEVIVGSVLDPQIIEEAIQGKEFVLTALSGRSTKPDYSVLSKGIENVVTCMEKAKVKRLISVAGAGILDDSEFGLRRNRPNYPEIFKLVSAENWKIYEYLKTKEINWTLVCAPEMPEEKRTGVYRATNDYLPLGGRRISVEDVADYILKILDEPETFKKRIGISY